MSSEKDSSCELEKQDTVSELKNRLNRWIDSKGLVTQRVVAASMPGTRLGLRTTRALDRGETYLKIPSQIIMDHQSASSPDSALFDVRGVRARSARISIMSLTSNGTSLSEVLE